MEIETITLKLSYNAKLHGEDEKNLRQAIKDIYFSGLIKYKLGTLIGFLADNLIVDVERT